MRRDEAETKWDCILHYPAWVVTVFPPLILSSCEDKQECGTLEGHVIRRVNYIVRCRNRTILIGINPECISDTQQHVFTSSRRSNSRNLSTSRTAPFSSGVRPNFGLGGIPRRAQVHSRRGDVRPGVVLG